VEAVSNRHYDLLILDLCLKGINGLTTYSRVRSIMPEMKAIIVSGALDLYEMELKEAQRDGVLGTLGKPFSLHALSAMVESALVPSSRAA
jgi:DNA-binding NtrC family response regulator